MPAQRQNGRPSHTGAFAGAVGSWVALSFLEDLLGGDGGTTRTASPDRSRRTAPSHDGAMSVVTDRARTGRTDDPEQVARAAMESLRRAATGSFVRNMALTTVARGMLLVLAVGFLAVPCVFLALRFDGYVTAILDAKGSLRDLSGPLIAILTPTLIGLGAAGLLVMLASYLQGRGNGELTRSMAEISRLIRESPTPSNARSRGLTQILEETIANARQAFTLQLVLSRVLFGSGVALLFIFVACLLLQKDAVVSGGAAVTSLLSFGVAAVFNPQRQIRSDLSTTTLLAAVLANYTRQTALVEEDLYARLADPSGDRAAVTAAVRQGVKDLDTIMAKAVDLIDEHLGTAEKLSPRETWLIKQLTTAATEKASGAG